MYIIDTYAWVEYFLGSERGEKVKEIIEDENNSIITPECCLAEIKGWAIRENLDFEELYRIVRIISNIQCVITKDWLDAASIRSDMRKNMKDFGMIDALVVAQQRRFGAKVVSGDVHFRELDGVVVV